MIRIGVIAAIIGVAVLLMMIAGVINERDQLRVELDKAGLRERACIERGGR